MEANTNNNRENFLIYAISELNGKENNEPTGMINCIPKIVLFQTQNCTFLVPFVSNPKIFPKLEKISDKTVDYIQTIF